MSETWCRIDSMFDTAYDYAAVDPLQLAGLVEQNAVELRQHEAGKLVLAAAWADAHGVEDDPVPSGPLVERWVQLGAIGTPKVAEFCVPEFAALNAVSVSTGRALITAALDLRHRMPRLWRQVRDGSVHAWKARKVAEATRCLSVAAAGEVDQAICGFIESVPWPRCETILQAAILDADPDQVREREQRAKTQRRVWCSDAEDGLTTIVARANSGDATWFMATVNRIADILKAQGSLELVGERRARAVGILAQPAVAIRLLAEHRHDSDAAERPAPHGLHHEAELQDLDLLDTQLGDLEPEEPQIPTPEPGEDVVAPPGFSIEPTDESAAPIDPHTAEEEAYQSLDVSVPAGLTTIDPARLRPKAVLYFHIAEAAVRDGCGLVRPEQGTAQSLDQLLDWLADIDCAVQVRPVVVPADVEPVDGYEIPQRVREAVRLREIADVFPYGICTSRTMDLDHTRSYVPPDEGGPPGQTGPDSLGPLVRGVHRAATHGRWLKRQPTAGTYVWRSPKGWIWLVTNQGTLKLGNSAYAQAVWRAARPKRATAA